MACCCKSRKTAAAKISAILFLSHFLVCESVFLLLTVGCCGDVSKNSKIKRHLAIIINNIMKKIFISLQDYEICNLKKMTKRRIEKLRKARTKKILEISLSAALKTCKSVEANVVVVVVITDVDAKLCNEPLKSEVVVNHSSSHSLCYFFQSSQDFVFPFFLSRSSASLCGPHILCVKTDGNFFLTM